MNFKNNQFYKEYIYRRCWRIFYRICCLIVVLIGVAIIVFGGLYTYSCTWISISIIIIGILLSTSSIFGFIAADFNNPNGLFGKYLINPLDPPHNKWNKWSFIFSVLTSIFFVILNVSQILLIIFGVCLFFLHPVLEIASLEKIKFVNFHGSLKPELLSQFENGDLLAEILFVAAGGFIFFMMLVSLCHYRRLICSRFSLVNFSLIQIGVGIILIINFSILVVILYDIFGSSPYYYGAFSIPGSLISCGIVGLICSLCSYHFCYGIPTLLTLLCLSIPIFMIVNIERDCREPLIEAILSDDFDRPQHVQVLYDGITMFFNLLNFTFIFLMGWFGCGSILTFFFVCPFYGSCSSNEKVEELQYIPKPGDIYLSVVDQEGKLENIKITKVEHENI